MSEKLNQILKRQKKQIDEPEKVVEDITQLVGFMIGSEEYAVPILNIQEIIKPMNYTRVPSVPSYVLGVFNVRGKVSPLIDLRQKFNLPTIGYTEDTRFIVMKDGDSEAGFVIDKLTEAIRIETRLIDPPPETIQHEESNMIYGIGKREDNILTILKVSALLKRDF